MNNSKKIFIKFLFIGIFNTGFGYGLYALFLSLDFHYSWAVFLSTVLGILFNFQTTGRMVFNNRNNRKLFKFILTYGCTYSINVIMLRFFASLEMNMYLAGAILTLPMAVLSFFLQRSFVFNERVRRGSK